MAALGCALLVLLSLTSLATSCTEQEKGFLFRFLSGLSQDGGLAVSWQRDRNCCKWEGITCNGNGVVTGVSLASRQLEGHISPSLSNLTNMMHLNLSYNSLSGGLPQELMFSSSIVALDVSFNRLDGGLQDLSSLTVSEQPLQILNISSNLFIGEFPSITWEKTRSLVALNASNNSFQGQIPSSFCVASSSFRVLDLSYNLFSGSIPTGLGNCSMLKVVKVGHNKLSGALPDELFNATSLEHLSLHNNGLQGTLDGALITQLINLDTLDLEGNSLSGNIPDSIGQLKRLKVLHLDRNKMYGELPSALGNCTRLTAIDLKGNNFSGHIGKVNFSSLSNLRTLDLYSNNFSGTIPESIYSCSSLTALRLAENHFHGELSTKIGSLKYLSFLSFGYNSFTNITSAIQILRFCKNLTILLMGSNFKGEVMPQDETIEGFGNLQLLSIERCSLSGEIPLWLSKLTNLEALILHGNRLIGPIPSWINSLSQLFYLDLSSNHLTREIPIALMTMPLMKSFDSAAFLNRAIYMSVFMDPSHEYGSFTSSPKVLQLGSNNFTGAIPPEIGELRALTILNLSFNRLYGEIPQSLCNLTNLQKIDLSSNDLIGVIPTSLNKLHFLSAFNVSNNELEGPTPSGGQFDVFDSSCYGGNPNLCGPMLTRHCNAEGALPASILSKEQIYEKVIFAIAFGAFFVVGVLYDQIVFSKYF